MALCRECGKSYSPQRRPHRRPGGDGYLCSPCRTELHMVKYRARISRRTKYLPPSSAANELHYGTRPLTSAHVRVLNSTASTRPDRTQEHHPPGQYDPPTSVYAPDRSVYMNTRPLLLLPELASPGPIVLPEPNSSSNSSPSSATCSGHKTTTPANKTVLLLVLFVSIFANIVSVSAVFKLRTGGSGNDWLSILSAFSSRLLAYAMGASRLQAWASSVLSTLVSFVARLSRRP